MQTYPKANSCEVYWGSHGCDMPRGHEKAGIPHLCLSCFDPDDMDGYVGAPPYYGSDTCFYGDDAELLGLPGAGREQDAE